MMKPISVIVILIMIMFQSVAWAKISDKTDSFYGIRVISSEYRKSELLTENIYGTNQRRYVFSKIIPAKNEPERYELMFSVIYRVVQPFNYANTADIKIGAQIFSMPLKKSETTAARNSQDDKVDLVLGDPREYLTSFLLGTYTVTPEILKAITEAPAGTKVLTRTEWSFSAEKNIDTFEVPTSVLNEWKQVVNTKIYK